VDFAWQNTKTGVPKQSTTKQIIVGVAEKAFSLLFLDLWPHKLSQIKLNSLVPSRHI
jgi:hypothetical protein